MDNNETLIEEIISEYPWVIIKLKGFFLRGYSISINALSDSRCLCNAMELLVLKIREYPDMIELKGVTLDNISFWTLLNISNYWEAFGIEEFTKWRTYHFDEFSEPEVIDLILERSVKNFAQTWYLMNNKQFPTPDWNELAKAEENALYGANDKIPDIYKRIIDTLQISALEYFLEKTCPEPFPPVDPMRPYIM